MSIVAETLRKIEEKNEENFDGVKIAGDNGGAVKIAPRVEKDVLLRGLLYFSAAAMVLSMGAFFFHIKTASAGYFSDIRVPFLTVPKQQFVMPETDMPVNLPVPEIQSQFPLTKIMPSSSLKKNRPIFSRAIPVKDVRPVLRLGGVMLGMGEPMAIINGVIAREGDSVDGAKIVMIGEKLVKYTYADKEYSLIQE